MVKNLLVATLLIASLASCRKVKDPEFQYIDQVKIKPQNLLHSVVAMNVNYFNPNSFNAKLKSAEGDAWVDSIYLGHFIVADAIDIPAKANFAVPVSLDVDVTQLLKMTMGNLKAEEVWLRIAGTARAGRGGIYRNIPLNYQGKQDLSKVFKDPLQGTK